LGGIIGWWGIVFGGWAIIHIYKIRLRYYSIEIMMKEQDFINQTKELLAQEVEGLDWDDKLTLLYHQVARAERVQGEKAKKTTQETRKSLEDILRRIGKFLNICAHFVTYMMKDEHCNFDEVKDLVREDVEADRRMREQKYALKVIFPKGHRSMFRVYEEYRSLSRFEAKMRRANRLVTMLHSYERRGVIGGFDSFTMDLRKCLEDDISKRAKQAGKEQLQSDLKLIPEAFGLRQLYRQYAEETDE
jgi:hypothetical protein